ncbi:GGDEF domain-containing protein [Modicisalibacter xianhensis]|uniref:diguanylate cyclase n=1 Tax=Modicisalibacter xianhensis TaxID=442341 RepID=A0A1I3A6G6_9GAMM|nr:GGDEF domain-containing protein [Halomonas xianhensis]SFH45466.1 diguanylate cyclase (GGDEF) domain-containing protein [Halomonas xianhensis]
MISDALRQSLAACPNLPSLPAAVLKVIELARDPDVKLQPLVEALNHDPALTARLISLANTVYYTQAGRPANTLREAVERLGLDMSVSLALGFSLAKGYGNRAQANGLDLHRYWQRSLTSAVAARELARHVPVSLDSDTIFTAALLQDIGMLALDAVEGPIYADTLHGTLQHDDISLRERIDLGADHTEIGAWLAASWGLSPLSCEWIRYSHDCPVNRQALSGSECVMLSGRLADIWLAPDGHKTLALLEPWLGNDKFRGELLSSIQEQLPVIAELFDVDAPGKIDPHQLLFESKQLLLERSLNLHEQLQAQERELAQLRESNAKLNEAIRFDPLTRLFNRQYLVQMFEDCFCEAQHDDLPLSLVFIDLDHFKQINDEHGHHFGDEVLRAFASLLQRSCEPGTIVGRYGGEEFLAILKNSTHAEASAFADALCAKLRAQPLLQRAGAPIFITASVGVVSLSDGNFSLPKEMIHVADQRMYLSKRQGRNRITAQ